jgi:competence protein ComEC
VLDVGQGLAIVLQTTHHALLYDTGPAFGPSADSGGRVIVPYLRAAGIRNLDGLIVSHDDGDHTGGAFSVLQAVPVAWLGSSLPDMDPLPLVAEDAFRCQAGQTWDWDGVHFAILHPERSSYDTRVKNNDRGCVLRVTAPGGTVLIPADVESRVEDALIGARHDLSANLLIAGHHGSKTSSTEGFVQAVHPEAVVFAAGYRNRFGHPHPDVVDRYRSIGSALYRSDSDGAVLVTIAPDAGMSIERYRARHRRYWLAAPDDAGGIFDAQLDRVAR